MSEFPGLKWKFLGVAFDDPALSLAARSALAALLTFHNTKTGRCNPSYETLARKAGLKRRATMAAAKELELAGWVRIKRDRGRTHTNAFSFPFEKMHETTRLEPEKVHFMHEKVHQTAPRTSEEHTGCKPVCDDEEDTIDAAARGSGAADASPRAAASIEEAFAEFRRIYPKRTAEEAARRAFRHIVTTSKATVAQILHAARQYAESKPRRVKDPDRWLWDGHYTDEQPQTTTRAPGPRQSRSRRPKSAADVGADL